MRSALAAVSDTSVLRQRETALRDAAANSLDPALERGLLLMRLHELTQAERDISQARSVLERASKKFKDDARVHYAYGLSNAVGHGVRIPVAGLRSIVLGQSIAEVLGTDPISKAKSSFRKALAADPLLVGAATQLARLSLAQRDRDNMRASAQALRHLQQQQRGGAEVVTLLSEVEAALGNVGAAASAASAATALDAGSSAALRAQAIALLRQGRELDAGARAYFEGVEQLDEASAKQYYDDVVPIATDAEVAAWANADLEQRKEWLRRFWNVRAASSGVTVGERMSEHFKRLATAHERYRREGKRGAAPGGSLLLEKYADDMLPFDDRGVIYVRHGEPDEIVRTSDVNLRPNETWVYRNGRRNTLYNFVVLRDGTDFRLVDDVLLALDASTSNIPHEAAVKLLEDRQRYEPRYAALANNFSSMASMTRRHTAEASLMDAGTRRKRLAEDMRKAALEGLATDTHEPDFTSDLPFYYDLFSFKGENGATELTMAAAVPGPNLSAQQVGNIFIYSIQASVILIDTATGAVARKDTTFSMRSSRMLGENEHVRIHLELPAQASPSLMHRVVLRDLVTPGVGQIYGGDAELKNFSGSALMVSDIVLAEPDSGSWVRGDAKLGLVPPRQFREGRPLRLFYEIYNLPANTQYRTEIVMESIDAETGFGRLKRLFGGGRKPVRLQFDGTAQPNADGVVQELRQVMAQVKPGKYRVGITITNLQTSEKAESETLFVVLKNND